MGPFTINAAGENDEIVLKPSRCQNCESGGPFTVSQSETIYQNFQVWYNNRWDHIALS